VLIAVFDLIYGIVCILGGASQEAMAPGSAMLQKFVGTPEGKKPS
jgi:hypothetical protein